MQQTAPHIGIYASIDFFVAYFNRPITNSSQLISLKIQSEKSGSCDLELIYVNSMPTVGSGTKDLVFSLTKILIVCLPVTRESCPLPQRVNQVQRKGEDNCTTSFIFYCGWTIIEKNI